VLYLLFLKEILEDALSCCW